MMSTCVRVVKAPITRGQVEILITGGSGVDIDIVWPPVVTRGRHSHCDQAPDSGLL